LLHPSAHVRAAAAGALGKYPSTSSTLKTLQRLAATDRSYSTIAAAIQTLAKWHAPDIDRVLGTALVEPSNNAVIASAALGGYATADGRAAIPLELRYARYGAPLDSRGAAIGALGRAGKGDPRVTTFLTGLLGDPDLVTNFAILRALTSLGDPGAIGAIRRLAATTEDERLRDRALAAADALAAMAKPPRSASRH
jgi:HEAT repeat protein